VFRAQADWTLTHSSHKDIEQSSVEASITLWRNTDWLTDQVITEWMTFSLQGDTTVSTDKMFWTPNKPAQWTLYTFPCPTHLIRLDLSTLIFSEKWPRSLRHELCSLARTLGSWVRIPLRAWMFGVCMRLFYVCVILCLGRGLATGWLLVQVVLPSVKNDYGTE
jgi:hypothetical protein